MESLQSQINNIIGGWSYFKISDKISVLNTDSEVSFYEQAHSFVVIRKFIGCLYYKACLL